MFFLPSIVTRRTLPTREAYLQIVKAATDKLRGEDQLVRPRDEHNRPGGLIRLQEGITMIVPDLHARIPFLLHALVFPVEGRPFIDLMKEGAGTMVCVGDGLHSEARAYQRWQVALLELLEGFSHHEAMDEEMLEGLGQMELVMRLKLAFPDRFHFLKGNHENILNREGNGDHPFRKFVLEGEMVRVYLQKFYGDDFLKSYADFERALPLVAADGNFMVSHAEPARSFSREEVIRYRSLDDVVEGLTWTPNDGSDEGSVQTMIESFCASPDQAVYFGGHRTIEGRYSLRASGRFIQLHNPSSFRVALADSGRPFDPERDIVDVSGDPAALLQRSELEISEETL
ncbi:metallophosphoesterase family protein [Sediminispirochaeta bajacaliforniensis]|uniref:metallophosphoesterase n=1 Tax=Sediminispirochaeta bajacaliforniensis TaxID=148 RepID=UPI000367869A|nr:metallophosphoesterase [Sediminispirochaeta bajacaliforniensis]